MTSSLLRSTLLAMLLAAFHLAQAQDQKPTSSNPLPSGPAPTPLVLPKSTGPVTVFSSRPQDVPPDTPELSEEESFCTTPSSTTYKTDRHLTAEEKKAVDLYARNTSKTISSNWKIPRGAGDPWRKGAVVRIRFEILPDGSLNNPTIMMTSGRASYDQSALDSIKHSAPFAPPPPVDTSPMKVCFSFGYRMDPSHTNTSDLPEDVFAKKKPSPR